MSGIADSGRSLGVSADPTNAMLAQFLQLLQRRKVLWEFKIGLVATATIGNSDLSVLLDGDDNPIICRTLIGPPSVGTKVAVIFVPPTGHYVIGIVGGQPIGPLGLVAGVNITTLGGLTAAASAETDIPQLHFSAAVSPLRSYELRLQMFFVATVATDAYDLNVRRDTAVTGSRIATLAGGGITNGPSSSAMWPLLPTVSETISFFVSFARRNGTGTFAPQGAPNAGVARTWVGLFDIGPANIFTTA